MVYIGANPLSGSGRQRPPARAAVGRRAIDAAKLLRDERVDLVAVERPRIPKLGREPDDQVLMLAQQVNRPAPQHRATVVVAQVPEPLRRSPPVLLEANAVIAAKHDALGDRASHQRANARRAAIAGKLGIGVRLDARAAARQPQEPRANGMPALVNRDAPMEVVVHDAKTLSRECALTAQRG